MHLRRSLSPRAEYNPQHRARARDVLDSPWLAIQASAPHRSAPPAAAPAEAVAAVSSAALTDIAEAAVATSPLGEAEPFGAEDWAMAALLALPQDVRPSGTDPAKAGRQLPPPSPTIAPAVGRDPSFLTLTGCAGVEEAVGASSAAGGEGKPARAVPRAGPSAAT